MDLQASYPPWPPRSTHRFCRGGQKFKGRGVPAASRARPERLFASLVAPVRSDSRVDRPAYRPRSSARSIAGPSSAPGGTKSPITPISKSSTAGRPASTRPTPFANPRREMMS